MEDILLCSKLYMNIVKQAPSKHNFYYNVLNNSLMLFNRFLNNILDFNLILEKSLYFI